MRRNGPSRAFLVRDQHRHSLTGHFFLLVIGLGVAFAVNRAYSPDTFWAPYVAAAWAVVFCLHVLVFIRGTIATMGGKREAKGKG